MSSQELTYLDHSLGMSDPGHVHPQFSANEPTAHDDESCPLLTLSSSTFRHWPSNCFQTCSITSQVQSWWAASPGVPFPFYFCASKAESYTLVPFEAIFSTNPTAFQSEPVTSVATIFTLVAWCVHLAMSNIDMQDLAQYGQQRADNVVTPESSGSPWLLQRA